jgi:dihydrofolate reductase
MEVILIAAQAKNRVIGKQGELPWYIPEDLKRFKQLTSGHPVIMGRKTYDSIVKRLGKPLPNRTNIVLTKQEMKQEGVFFCATPQEALSIAQKHNARVYVIGGQTIYEQFMPHATTIELTQLSHDVEGDAHFPLIDKKHWQIVREDKRTENNTSYSFIRYERMP